MSPVNFLIMGMRHVAHELFDNGMSHVMHELVEDGNGSRHTRTRRVTHELVTLCTYGTHELFDNGNESCRT